MKIQAGNRVYWIDPETNHRHKCEVTRVYTKKAKILTDDLRSLSVDIDDIDLVPLSWKTNQSLEISIEPEPARSLIGAFVESRTYPMSRGVIIQDYDDHYWLAKNEGGRVLYPKNTTLVLRWPDGSTKTDTSDGPPGTIEQISDRPVGSIVSDGEERTIEQISDRPGGSIVSDGEERTIEQISDRPVGSIVSDAPDGTIEQISDRPVGSIVSDAPDGTIELDSDHPVGSIVSDAPDGTIEQISDRPVGSIVSDAPDGTIEQISDRPGGSIVSDAPDGTIELDSDRPNGSIVEIEQTIERLEMGELIQLQRFISKLIPIKRSIPRSSPRGSVNRYECKGSSYWRYTYSIAGKTKHRHITGGSVGSPPSDERAAMVRGMIEDGKPVGAIVAWLDNGDRG